MKIFEVHVSQLNWFKQCAFSAVLQVCSAQTQSMQGGQTVGILFTHSDVVPVPHGFRMVIQSRDPLYIFFTFELAVQLQDTAVPSSLREPYHQQFHFYHIASTLVHTIHGSTTT